MPTATKRRLTVRVIRLPETQQHFIELHVLGQVLRSPPFSTRECAVEFKQALTDFFKGTRW